MQTDLPSPTERDPYFLTYPEIDKVYSELRRLKESLGPKPSRRDRAELLIGACILHRFATRHQIVKALGSIGLSKAHVVRVLDERTGPIPGEHLWVRDEAGRYQLLDAI